MTAVARITAIDRFIKGCREDGIYDDLNACCVMAGWDSLAGALTPLKGSAPTNANFIDADLDRGIGLQGNGSSKYLNSNRANNAESQNDKSLAAYISSLPTSSGSNRWSIGDDGTSVLGQGPADKHYGRINDAYTSFPGSDSPESGFVGANRSDSVSKTLRLGSADYSIAAASATPSTANLFIFRRNEPSIPGYSDATLAFYSIGSATNLALLDARVSTLMADLRAIEEVGFDRDAIAYIRAVEEADGAYLETSVKTAINNLVSGLKSDGLWESMASTCLLCGPRTLAGALVPLRGAAPTAQGGWASGDYDRATGLTGDPTASLYLDSNRPANADDQNDNHWAIYIATPQTVGGRSSFGSGDNVAVSYHYHRTATGGALGKPQLQNNVATNYNTTNELEASGLSATSRSSGSAYDWASGGDSGTINQASVAPSSYNAYVFAINSDGSDAIHSDATISFYSIGSSIDLAKLDTHISDYVTAIGAAL